MFIENLSPQLHYTSIKCNKQKPEAVAKSFAIEGAFFSMNVCDNDNNIMLNISKVKGKNKCSVLSKSYQANA